MVAPVYAGNGASDPSGCLVRWKAADVVLNGGGVAGACTAGNADGYFRAGVAGPSGRYNDVRPALYGGGAGEFLRGFGKRAGCFL